MAKTSVDDVLGAPAGEDAAAEKSKTSDNKSTSSTKNGAAKKEDKKAAESGKEDKEAEPTADVKEVQKVDKVEKTLESDKDTEKTVKDENTKEISKESDSKEQKTVKDEKSKDSETKTTSDEKQPRNATGIKVGTRIPLNRPTPIYRGPGYEFRVNPFGGTVEVTGETDKNGFTPVSFVRSGYGLVSGYIRLPKGVETSCQS